MPAMTVTEQQLDAARADIAPSLGAVAYTVGANQIETMGMGENSSFQQVLLQVPGVVQEEFGEVHVRGDHGDLQYRINGVLLPENLNGFAQEIDTHLIQAVTLMTGTLPAQFGDRTAGVIDVTTKTGGQLNGSEFSVYGGSYDTFNPSLEMGGTFGQLDTFTSLSYLHDDHGIDNTTSSPDPLHDATNQERLFTYLSRALDPTSRLTLILSDSDARFQIPDTPGVAVTYQLPDAPAANSAAADNNQVEENEYAVLAYQKSAGPLSYQISAFSRYADIDFHPDVIQSLLLAGYAGFIDNSDFANGVQIDGSCEAGGGHTIRAGLLATRDVERLDTLSAVFPSSAQFTVSPADDSLPDSGGPAPLPANPPQSSLTPFDIAENDRNTGVAAGIYLQDEWQLTPQLTVNYGLRADRFDASFDDEGQVSPRLNLVWKDGATTLHAGYARYFMPPTLQYVNPAMVKEFEYTTNAPFNATDDPQRVERDNYFDAGFSRRLAPGLQLTGDSFCKLARHLLDDGQFGTAVILNNFNYRKGTVYGSELSAAYRRGSVSLHANFSYVQTRAQEIDSVENEFPNNALAYIAQNPIQLDHQGRIAGSGGIAWTLPGELRLHSDFLYGNGLRAGFANLDKLPQYWTANAGVERSWRLDGHRFSEVKLRFDCINVLNSVAEIRDGTGVGIAAAAYAPRRGYYGGLTLVF